MDDSHSKAPGEVDFAKLFKECRTVAVVGYSDNPARAGYFVTHYMAEHGYKMIAINPRFKDKVNGLPCYPNLAAIPPETQIDIVNIFRSPEHIPPLVEEAAKLDPRPKYFWMQPGAENESAAQLAREQGMEPVQHACLMAAHKIWV
jgi:uncharacterized protein